MSLLASSLALAWPLAIASQTSPPATPPAAGDEELLLRRTFEQKLAAHKHFSKLAFERVESRAPYLFLIQETAREDPARAPRLADQYAEMLAPVLARFEREVAEPLALGPREEHLRFTLVLLASQGDMVNYASLTGAREHLADCYYDRALDAVVLYEDAFGDRRPPDERARSARHGFVHACQQAWHAADENAPLESWVLEGMADAWARRAPVAKSARIDQGWLRLFARDAQAGGEDEHEVAASEAWRWVALRTLQELVTVNEPSRLLGFLRTHTPAGAPELDLEGAWWAFYRQASLVHQFLEEAGDGRHRPLLTELHRAAFLPVPESGAAPVTLPAALDAEFLSWMFAAHRAALAGDALEPGAFDGALARGPNGAPLFSSLSGAPGTSPAASTAPAEPPAPPLDLADLTPDERLARALHELAHGSASRAVAALEAFERETVEAAPRERARRELERARAWLRVREAHVRALIAAGKTLEFEVAGRKYKAKALALEQGTLRLEKNRSGVESLALDDLDALELAQDVKPAGGPDDWARLVPYVLRGDARARKLLADGGREATALLRDASEDYPARLRLGAAVARLEELAAQPLPSTPDETRARLAELAACKAELGDLALVQRKAAALRGRARTLLVRQAELLGPGSLLAGKLEVLAGERVRISYAFDDARELQDFDPALYPVFERKRLAPEMVEDEPFRIEDGQLIGAGQAALRSLIDLAAPLTVRYSLELVHRGSERTNIAVGLCDDGREHFLWCRNLEHLERVEAKETERVWAAETRVFMDVPYAIELRHDGERLTLFMEDQEQRSIPAGGLRSGAVFLCSHSDSPGRFARLELEGTLLPGSFARLARAWVERELARY